MRVLITQPYVPEYRVPLFSTLGGLLERQGGSLTVAVGGAARTQLARSDATRPGWVRDLRSVRFPLGHGRALQLRALPAALREPDVLVTEFDVSNLLAWQATRRSTPVVLWGHGKTYVRDTDPWVDRLKGRLARRATQVMTYTEGGRSHVVTRLGVPAEVVTAIGNSTDTLPLRRAAVRFRDRRSSGPSAAFIGGLDDTKRLDFLLDAARHAHALDPRFELTFVGRGPKEEEIRKAARVLPFVHHTGGAHGETLAEAVAHARAVWMPGRVGLVAVDALALGLPVHTVRFPHHAPEAELLRPGEIEFLPDDPTMFARTSLGLMHRDPVERPGSELPTVEKVAANFLTVIERAWSDRVHAA